MKRAIALLLAIVAVLSFAGCQKTAEQTPTTSLRDESMPNKLLVSDVTSLPIATDDMTIAQRQDLIIKFMELQVSFQWMTNQDILDWPSTYGGGKKTIETPNIYGGIPYQSVGFGNPYRWLEYYDETTGVMDMQTALAENGGYGEDAAVTDVDDLTGYKKYRSLMTFFNQCTSSTSWSWGRVINSVRFGDTKNITAYNGFIPVGGYTYGFEYEGKTYGPEDIQIFGKDDNGAALGNPIGYDTKHVIADWIAANGEYAMYDCYLQMKPGDCLVNGGHAMMVKEVRPATKEDGTMDYNMCLVIVNEQVEGWAKKDKLGEKKLFNQGSKEGAYTLSALQDKKYLPFTFPELQDPNDPQGQKYLAYYNEMMAKTQAVDKLYSVFTCTADCKGTGVEKSQVFCTKENGTITMADFAAMTVGSNYSISDVFVTVTDSTGAVKVQNIFRAGSTHVREVSMTAGNSTWKTDADGNRLTLCEGLDAFADGNHTVTVTLQLSTGEKLTAFTGTLTA